MDKTIGDFVNALRKAELGVSPAESLDAMAALQVAGFRDKSTLKRTLSIVLAKTEQEKYLFDVCFDRFFADHKFDELKQLSREYHSQEVGGDGAGLGAGEDSESGTEGKRRHRHSTLLVHHDSHLGHLLLDGDEPGLLQLLMKAVEEVHLENIKSLRERNLFVRRILLHMGIKHLDAEIERLTRLPQDSPQRTARLLGEGRQYLSEKVTTYVEQQYFLIVDGTGQGFILDALMDSRLTNIQPFYLEQIREVIRKLAHRIAKQHAKRKKMVNRGQLDIRKTLRRNLAYDGSMFDLRWKQTRLERPKVFVICDVSGSVKNVARFLLTFIYSLSEVLPNVRSFAFSNELGEVTELFAGYKLEDAAEMSLDDWGKGSTDYGQALQDFKQLALRDVDSKSTIVILGDARSNYYNTRTDILKEMSHKAHQIIWLNPEQRNRWNQGDAVMKEFLPHCTYAEVCNSISDLELMVGNILQTARR